MNKLPKFQEPAGNLPTYFVPGTIIPDQSKMSAVERFEYQQNSPFQQFINTVNSKEGKQNQRYSGNYHYVSTKDNSRPHWEFIRSEEPLKPMEQEIVEVLPGTGDVAEVTQIGKDLFRGNVGSALLGASLFFIPGNLGKINLTNADANNIIDSIRKLNIDDSYQQYGFRMREAMNRIPGNQPIVDQLTDSELGYLLQKREEAIKNIPKNQRVSIVNGGYSPRDNFEIHNIDVYENGKIGTAKVKYNHDLDQTVSISKIDNLTNQIDGDNIQHGVSYNVLDALLQYEGRPILADSRWLDPKKTKRVYNKYDQDLSFDDDMFLEYSLSDILNSDELLDELGKNMKMNKKELLAYFAEHPEITSDSIIPIKIPYRPVISSSSKLYRGDIVKHQNLFKLSLENMKDGIPTVLWNNPDPYLKSGGVINENNQTRN